MADQRNLSVEEILSACRAADGGGGAADVASTPEPAPVSEKPASKPKAAAGDARKMSVEEMLAAARGDAGASASSDTASDEPSVPSEQPAAVAAKSPGKMSVAEMLAAARGGASKEKPKPAAKAPVAKKPTAKKPAAAAAEKKEVSRPKDTTSILAMARKERKPGPISKAEAASQGQGVTAKRKMPEMPERPAYVQPAAPAANEDRRTFFGSFFGAFLGSSLAVGFSSLAVTNVLWVLGGARFMFPNILTEPPTVFKVGFPGDYALGQVQAKFKAQFGVWVVKADYEGVSQVYALKSVCTHLGCTPNWLEGEQKFKCPCHGSGFYKDGVNFEGPAPRPLERYAIRVADDGQLEVDKSRTFQLELGQWSDVASFVAS